jgi:hypothetical protein
LSPVKLATTATAAPNTGNTIDLLDSDDDE